MPNLVPCQGPEHYDVAVHIVLEDFGKLGRAYRETDEAEADEQTLINDILAGEFGHIARIISFNTIEGWSRDVTEDIAREVAETAMQRDTEIRGGARELVDRFLNDTEVAADCYRLRAREFPPVKGCRRRDRRARHWQNCLP